MSIIQTSEDYKYIRRCFDIQKKKIEVIDQSNVITKLQVIQGKLKADDRYFQKFMNLSKI